MLIIFRHISAFFCLFLLLGNFAMGQFPQVDLNGDETGLDYTQETPANTLPVFIGKTGEISITNPNNPNIESTLLRLTNPKDQGEEIFLSSLAVDWASKNGLKVNNQGNVITITGQGDIETYEQIISRIFYRNPNTDPDTTTRTITIILGDGQNIGAAANSFVNIRNTPTFPPELSLSGNSSNQNFQTLIHGEASTQIADSAKILTDQDSPLLTSMTIQVLKNFDGTEEGLTISPDFEEEANARNIQVVFATNHLVKLTGYATIEDYKWVLDEIQFRNDKFRPSYGTRTVRVTVDDGLFQTSALTLLTFEDERPEIIAYEGISPNGDGMNDTWVIDNIEQYPENVVRIYNRWGVLIYEVQNYDNQERVWDGTSNQNAFADSDNTASSTYFYVIDLGEGLGEKNGFIILER